MAADLSFKVVFIANYIRGRIREDFCIIFVKNFKS